jgi:hypothetical protein
MTKYLNDKYGKGNNKDTPIVFDNSWTQDINKIPICSYCRRDLIKLQTNGKNISWYCPFDQIETPEEDNLRNKSRLSTPSKSNADDPSVSYTVEPTLTRKTVEYKGGTAVLSKKGTIKITGYKEGKG